MHTEKRGILCGYCAFRRHRDKREFEGLKKRLREENKGDIARTKIINYKEIYMKTT